MSNVIHPFIKKEHPEIPDAYAVKIFYLDGKMEEFNVAQHRALTEISMLELVSNDDVWFLVPFSSIKKIEFDKNFSKIMDIKQKLGSKVAG